MTKYITPDDSCTGCGLCEAVCQRQAISLLNDEYGFRYPKVDRERCILCRKCVKTCPVYGKWDSASMYTAPMAYAGYNLNETVRFNSSSGGIFTAVADAVFNRGGVIYGASYKDDLTVEHVRITDRKDINKLQGSKYVQSWIPADIYRMLVKDIENGNPVLFSGTPCQTAAISSRFGKYANLLTVDVICHGVPSPMAWRSYLTEAEQCGSIQSVNMREKSHGWNNFHMVISYKDGQKSDMWFNDNPWGKSFVRNLFLRESCYNCDFKKQIRSADISLGDFWEAARGTHTEFDDGDKGTSVVLINSPKGESIIKSILGCKLEEIPYDWIPDKTYAVARSSSRNPDREKAFRMLNDGYSFSRVVGKCTKSSLLTRVIRKAKRVLGKA